MDVRIDGCGYGGEGVTDMYSGEWVLFWWIACVCGGRDECDVFEGMYEYVYV